MDHCGILYNTYDRLSDTYTPAQLPLEELRVRVWVVDVTARISLTQKFYNPASTRTGRAKYCFPVPASAAVCAFQLTSSDGRVIKGECKEKELAQEQYEAAMASGEMAGLLEYVTDDIFTISVGFIPPHTVAETHLVYAMSLYTGDYLDQVRLQLPGYVGQRYGIPPEGLAGAVQPPRDRTRISITADIQMSGRIQEVVSPNHPSEIEETRYDTHLGRPSRRRTTVRYKSNSYLDRDFILLIRAKDLDQPRCFVEVRKDSLHPDSLALQLTMVPKTKLPSVKSQRYLFVVDRSGSMMGRRIETAKRVVLMMLRMMPSQASSFNIFGFGSDYTSWKQISEKYTQHALENATSYVEGIDADMGGTEIREALRAVFASSPPDMSTVIFVLTDGEVNDIDGTTQEVSQFVNSSIAPRRVFTLGIGNEVSTDMCEAIARAGNGECLLAVDTESIVQKCVKLFNASRTPFIRNITLDWGVSGSSSSVGSPGVTFSNQPSPRSVATRPLPAIQQTPLKIDAIHSGTRLNVFAIVTSRHAKPPKQVVLSGVLDDETYSPFELKIPVQQIALVRSEDDTIPLIHTMAAWRLIQEYTENPAVPLPRPLGVATEDELRQSVIVQLAVMYQVASRHTSFVAIEANRDARLARRLKQAFIRRYPEYAAEIDNESDTNFHNPLEIAQHQLKSAWVAMTSALAALTTLWSAIYPTVQSQQDPEPPGSTGSPSASSESLPGAFPRGDAGLEDRNSFSGTHDEPTEYGSMDSERSSIKTFSTISSLDGWRYASSSDWSTTDSDDSDASYLRVPSPTFRHRQLEPEDLNRTPQQRDSRTLEAVLPSVVELVKLQQFDGSYPQQSIDSIVPIIGAPAVEAQKLSGAEREVWATVLCVAFLKKQLEHNPDLLDNLLVKPMEYLRSKRGIDIDGLLEKAVKMLQ